MSSKTRTRTTRTTASTTGSAPTLRSVPEQTVAAKVRTDAEDRLWKVLRVDRNRTAADLSVAAKIGKSTAQKILVTWSNDGSVTRTAGIAEAGRRAADLWAITEVNTTQPDLAPVGTDAAKDSDTTDTAHTEPDAPVVVPVVPDAPATDDATDVEGDPVDPTDTTPTDTAADDAQDPVETDKADRVEAEPVVADVNEPAADGEATDVDRPTEDGADATSEKNTRLAPGGLRGMVEDYLRDHPGEQFGPTAIANALGGKSSGAVSNALDKLVEGGVAAKTQDKPRRFALAPSEQEAAPAPTK
ncbi:MarR family transcriptional regulator [Amycolatopsis sp. H20-H5]|uniref:MarR family transcriptional regulator n=1 Tax=Amycolatopsis sp. H20-H5 TaxID=3046309 RepID=UPI002DB9AF23|nr:MarR family transcriptional regulator [Amycolatopsis sp. H20-H5]MEC3974950.1 MarR family transcriptional regulator [Amycolatopsis sp. H20-H5]